jgi:hypothetical protein
MVRKGERYRASEAVAVGVMTHWDGPFTGGGEATLPAGEEFVVSNDPRPGATAVYCDPVRYDALHSLFVPKEDRDEPGYGGYDLCVALEAIQTHCENVGATPCPDAASPSPAAKRPWAKDRERIEAEGAIGVLVPLLGGSAAYRLVPAEEAGPHLFRLLGSPEPGEVWAFQPGDVVRCLIKVFSLGERGESEWLAFERVDP